MDWGKAKIIKLIRPGHIVLVVVIALVLAGGAFAGISIRNSIIPSGIVIHHSAIPPTPDGRPVNSRVIDDIHRERGYGTFYWGRNYYSGFHYVILPDGTVERGRPEHCLGAHALGYNSYIGICLVGDFSSKSNPTGAVGLTEPSTAQLEALTALCRRLREEYGIPMENLVRHSDVNPKTECPGDRFQFREFIKRLQ